MDPVTVEDFNALERGDVIRNVAGDRNYIVLITVRSTYITKIQPAYQSAGGAWIPLEGALARRGRAAKRWFQSMHRGGWELVAKGGGKL